MSNFFVLFRNELFRLLLSGGFYFIVALFLFTMGISYLLILNFYNNEALDVCTLQSFFEIFWIPALFIVPLLTMRVLAEDRRSGMLESLLSTPIGTRALILSKFFATYLAYLSMWLLSILYPIFAQISHASDLTMLLWTSNALIGGILFTLMSSAIFISIGIFASSLTKSQSVAGILTFCLLFTMFATIRALMDFCGPKIFFWKYINFSKALSDLSAGMIDSRFVVFSLITTALVLLLSSIALELKSLR